MKVAVLAGGRSSEHEVSLASAQAVRAGLAELDHEVLDVRISREGKWSLDGKAVKLEPAGGLLGADVVFPVVHGPYGEDGTLQGLLQHLDVPYVGSGSLASAVCIDKAIFKRQMTLAGIPQVEYEIVQAARWSGESGAVAKELACLGLPVFVKPARLGSSVGISKVKEPKELPSAIESALVHDSVVLVEAMAPGQEIECSILGTRELTISEPGEIVIESEWFDYKAKYTPGGMELKVPATISETARRRVQETAERAFRYTGCAGMARVDFFVDGEEVKISEINTIPGFTKTSVYAKLLEASGILYQETLETLLADAVGDYGRYRRYRH